MEKYLTVRTISGKVKRIPRPSNCPCLTCPKGCDRDNCKIWQEWFIAEWRKIRKAAEQKYKKVGKDSPSVRETYNSD